MRGTRKVVKDPIIKGQNRGYVEDMRVQKMSELERFKRDNGHGGLREQIDGFAQVPYRCIKCGTRNHGTRQPAAQITIPCSRCRRPTLQERVR